MGNKGWGEVAKRYKRYEERVERLEAVVEAARGATVFSIALLTAVEGHPDLVEHWRVIEALKKLFDAVDAYEKEESDEE